MDNKHNPALLVLFVCIMVDTFYPQYLTRESGVVSALLYSFTHANSLHFAANAIALWHFAPRWRTCAVAVAVAVAVGLVPFAVGDLPTCGLSGFVLACYARRYWAYRSSLWLLVLTNVGLAFIPHLNWRVHLLCFAASYIYWACESAVKCLTKKNLRQL